MSTLYEEMVVAGDKMNEHNDCTVVALAISTGKSYKESHRAMYACGRKSRHTTSLTNTLFPAFELLGYKLSKLNGHAMNKPKTICTLERTLPERGRFIVYVRGHVLAIRSGAIHDWSSGRRNRIVGIWEVIKI